MRKLALPLLAACAVFAVSAPVASAAKGKSTAAKLSTVSGAVKGLKKALKQLKDVDSGQTGAIGGVDDRVDTVVANLDTLGKKVDAIVAVATDSLTKLQAGLVTLGGVVNSSVAAKPTFVVAQVFAGTAGVAANAIRGCFVAVPVPFSGNIGTTTISCPVVQIQTNPGLGENTPAAGGALSVLASCRTAKTNVDLANGKPCALAGIANLTVVPFGGSQTTFLTSKPNAALGGVPAYPMDANKLASKDESQAAFPLSLSTGGTDTVDDPAKLLNLTDSSRATAPAGAPTLGNCTGGATPCFATVTFTLRAADNNAQLP